MGSYADWLHLNVLFKFPGPLLVATPAGTHQHRQVNSVAPDLLNHPVVCDPRAHCVLAKNLMIV